MCEMAEELLIKRRLLLDGNGTGDDKRLHIFTKQLAKWVHSYESVNNCDIYFNRLMAQLHYFELNRKKIDLINKCNSKQMEKYTTIQTTFEARTELIKKDIEKQENLLKRAKVVKKNLVEYDLMVQTVNQHPCRMDLKEKIENLKKEITDLEKEKEHLGSKFNFKVKQCHVLSTSANAIKGILKEENTNTNTDWDMSSPNTHDDLIIILN